MKRNLFLQLTCFCIYVINHIAHLALGYDLFSDQKKLWLSILLTCFVGVFFYDYFFNFKKTGKFKVPMSLLLVYSTTMWLFDGNYLLAIANAAVFAGILLYQYRLSLKEGR